MTDTLTSCCGIDCATCSIYLAAQDTEAARRLAEAWQAAGTPDAQPDWFKCQGCRGERSACWSDNCELRSCCTDRGLTHCGQCGDFPCATYLAWIGPYPHHRAAYEKLLAERDSGKA